jgi:type IV pilus assembly protein PilM
MPRSILGLDIGTSSVRAAEVSIKSDSPTLERFASVALPRGAVSGGEVVDAALVTAAIKELISKGRFRVKRTAIGIANQKVVVRQIDMPFMEEEELRGALQFQAQEYIPIPIEDAILDFQVLEESVGEGGERLLKVLLVAAQRDMINTFVTVAEEAGLDPAIVDLSPFADMRALTSAVPLLGGRESEAIIDVGGGVTNIVVHEHGKPRFVRILPMGGNDITDALVAGLGIDAEEAESVKARVGLSAEGGPVPAEGAARLIEQRASAFIDEVRGSLDYYLSQQTAARINTVILTGGGSKLPGLHERLAAALHLPVEEGQPLSSLKLGNLSQTPEELAHLSAVSAVAIGLATRSE